MSKSGASDLEAQLREAAEAGDIEKVTKILAQGKVDINAKIEDLENYGRTALHLAVENGHLEVVKKLLEHGANFDQKDGKFYTAKILAFDLRDKPNAAVDKNTRHDIYQAIYEKELKNHQQGSASKKDEHKKEELPTKSSKDDRGKPFNFFFKNPTQVVKAGQEKLRKNTETPDKSKKKGFFK